jgi:hypothetical protein
LYITKILALKQDSRFRSGRFSNGRIPTKVRKATQKLRGSAILGQARLNRDRKTPYVIRQDADKQLCQLPESGEKKASFAHLARRPRGPILA